jgi:uncharacterized protein involved in exopolysaccharide biosynthesis
MPDPMDDYIGRLAQALRQRGIDDPRFVSESREHLLDMVAEGRRRGLSLEEAERDAFERFGAPEFLAAHAVSEGDRPMSRLAVALDTIWQRKWWILVPAGVAAMVTTVAATYLLPTRYRSEAVISISAQRLPAHFASSAPDSATHRRFQEIARLVLSRPRLEQIIMDFELYDAARNSTPSDDLVMQMRSDIALAMLDGDQESSSDLGGFRVSFAAATPQTAMRVTQRIASLFIEENARDQQALAGSVTQFIDRRIDDTRRRIIEYEAKLDELRTQRGNRPLSRADLLPYEVLQESYRTLLTRAEDARTTEALERRQIGDQFRILEPPRLPNAPLGPSRVSVSVWGAFAGLGVGLLILGVRSRSRQLAT